MAVRNFWIDADIDGRKTHLSGGPQSASGGFHARFYWRDKGNIQGPIAVWGMETEGKLVLWLIKQDGTIVPLVESER